jgi:hypothetical protein
VTGVTDETSESKGVSPEMQPETRAVRRWSFTVDDAGQTYMQQCGHGEYVKFTAYDSREGELLAKNETLARTVEELTAANAALRDERDAYEIELKADIEAFRERDRIMEQAADNTMRLIRERDQAQAELREARAALEKYGWHDIKKCAATNTNGVRFVDQECTCGFDAAIKGSKP